MPLAARIDDGDRPPQAVPPHLRVAVVEPPWAQAHLFRALSESGCGDNNPDSFSRSFVGALLPARGHDPGSHVGWIRSAFPRKPTGWRGEDFLYAQALDSLPKVIPIDLIPVSQQVTRRLIFGKRLHHLLPCPPRRGMLRHVEVYDAAAMMSQHDQHEQHPKADRRHGEEVDRDEILDMVVKESYPSLGRGSPVLGHEAGNRALRNRDSQLEQF